MKRESPGEVAAPSSAGLCVAVGTVSLVSVDYFSPSQVLSLRSHNLTISLMPYSPDKHSNFSVGPLVSMAFQADAFEESGKRRWEPRTKVHTAPGNIGERAETRRRDNCVALRLTDQLCSQIATGLHNASQNLQDIDDAFGLKPCHLQ